MSILDQLSATIEARKGADPDTSWTAKLLSKGPEKCAEKFGEDVELWRHLRIAAEQRSDERLMRLSRESPARRPHCTPQVR